ncbi:uncharacterized protein LOC6530601 isoform X1 [Drosophila yakuba]|uniref:Uncharacterized protein, isoform B n=1 Tax=Drosophila yakuba TaxID=7245 RepID=B4P8X2_DROYA|nr:uncharacterized protein LOC6530601 isoform X1 [Drosophila yakuba]EDW91226.2 uncharacterized protein Dyak_GE12202, isoform B [Drosophila yakuba]
MKMQRLHVIPGKHKDHDKCLIELYKPKKFVAESLTSVYSSHTTVAPNGFIHTDSVRGIEDRHLTVSPELPSLMERSSQSQNKNLYDLSLQLMDQEDAGHSDSEWSDENGRIRRRDSGPDIDHRNGLYNERTFNLKERLKVRERMKVKDAGYYRKRMPPVPNMEVTSKRIKKRNRENAESEVGPLNSKPNHKLRRKIPESYESLCAEPVILPSKTPEVTRNPTTLSTQKIKVQPQPVDCEKDVDSFKYSENPKKTFRAIVGRAAQNAGYQNQDGFGEEDQKVKLQTIENINLGKLLRIRAAQQFHRMLDLIDDHYIYSLLLLLATLAYLVYILWYDISDNLNEEGRYLGKMKASRLPMKCFYYLMRLLRAPIF